MSERVSIAANLRSALSAYSLSTEQGEVVDLSAAAVVSSGINYAVFNAIILSEPVSAAEFERILATASRFYRARGIEWSCWLCEEMVEEAAPRLLESHGLRWIADHDGMAAVAIRPATRRLPYLNARPVADTQTRQDFVHVCTQAFALPGKVASEIYGSERFWGGPWRAWVGYDPFSRPICIAATDADCGSVGLYSVGTVPDMQRRGYGEAITRHVLQQTEAQTGIARSILQSTPAGRGLYRRMGYQSRARISVWSVR
jgi:ribosomal protein S18 acetylase RimI-like enzyme